MLFGDTPAEEALQKPELSPADKEAVISAVTSLDKLDVWRPSDAGVKALGDAIANGGKPRDEVVFVRPTTPPFICTPSCQVPANAAPSQPAARRRAMAQFREMLKSMDLPEGAEVQAEQFWSMLDNMAAEDPVAYKAFIERQMQEAKAGKDGASGSRSFTPEAAWCLRSTAVPLDASRPARPIFLNMCRSPVLEPPQDATGTPVVTRDGKVNAKLAMDVASLSIPLTIGKLRQITVRGLAKNPHKRQTVDVADVIFHPWTLQRADKDRAFRRSLVELAVHWAGKEHDLVVSPETVDHTDSPYMAGVKGLGGAVLCQPYVVTEADLKRQREAAAGGAAGAADGGGSARVAPPTAATPSTASTPGGGAGLGAGGDPVLPHHAAAAAASVDASSGLTELRLPTSGSGAARAPAPLIQEVGDSGAAPALPVPTVTTTTAADGSGVTVEIELPGLASMADVELDVEERLLSLSAPGFARVVEALPVAVNHAAAKAKFRRSRHVVAVRMPVLAT